MERAVAPKAPIIFQIKIFRSRISARC